MAFEDILDYKRVTKEEELLEDDFVPEVSPSYPPEAECECEDDCAGGCGGCGHHLEYGGVYRISVPARSIVILVNQVKPDRQYNILTPSGCMRKANMEVVDELLQDEECLTELLFNVYDNPKKIVKKIKELFEWET